MKKINIELVGDYEIIDCYNFNFLITVNGYLTTVTIDTKNKKIKFFMSVDLLTTKEGKKFNNMIERNESKIINSLINFL